MEHLPTYCLFFLFDDVMYTSCVSYWLLLHTNSRCKCFDDLKKKKTHEETKDTAY